MSHENEHPQKPAPKLTLTDEDIVVERHVNQSAAPPRPLHDAVTQGGGPGGGHEPANDADG